MYRRAMWLPLIAAMLIVPPRLSAAETPADPLRPIDLEVRVAAPRTSVWHAWTTNDGVRQWFAPGSNIELRPGGPYEILFLPDAPAGLRGAEGLKVLAFLPQELLAFEWNAPPQFVRVRPHRTWVVVRLTEIGDGDVRVQLNHAGFAEGAAAHPADRTEWAQVRDYFAKAWPRVLANLEKRFAKPAADVGPLVCEAVVDAPRDQVWKAFASAEGWKAWNVAHCEMELAVGGRIRSHYDPQGRIGDANTIENLILAYEPQRMLAIRIGQPPEKFPFRDAARHTWTVITLEDAGPDRTRVRVVGLGYQDDPESKQMRTFFERGNANTLKKLRDHFTKPTG